MGILEIMWNQWLVLMVALGHCTAMYIIAVLVEPHMRIAKARWRRYLASELGWRGIWEDEDLRVPKNWRKGLNQ